MSTTLGKDLDVSFVQYTGILKNSIKNFKPLKISNLPNILLATIVVRFIATGKFSPSSTIQLFNYILFLALYVDHCKKGCFRLSLCMLPPATTAFHYLSLHLYSSPFALMVYLLIQQCSRRLSRLAADQRRPNGPSTGEYR